PDPVELLMQLAQRPAAGDQTGLELRADQFVHRLGAAAGEHRPPAAGERRLSASADPGGQARGEPAADLVEEDLLGSVENRQVHHHSGTQVQFVKVGIRALAQLVVAVALTAESQSTAPESVAERTVLEPVQSDQLIEDAMRGRARQPGAPRDLLEVEPTRS